MYPPHRQKELKKKKLRLFTRLHVNSLDSPVLAKQPFQLRVASLILKIPHEHRPHPIAAPPELIKHKQNRKRSDHV